MKKQFQLIVQFKFVWGLVFTATILLYSIISIFQGKTSIELSLIWKFVFITIIVTFIHYIVFGDYIFSSLTSKYKIALHFILCFIVMFTSSYYLNWIKDLSLYSIFILTISYTLLYLSICTSLSIYYRITGEKLNNRLKEFKENKNRRERR